MHRNCPEVEQKMPGSSDKINKLPDYIEKINVGHNDGIIIKPFENTKLEENCINLPSFSFALEQAEYEEKNEDIEYFRITKIQGAKVFIKLVT
jgi:hypothetical protein